MDYVQKRPLSGMVLSGVSAPRAIGTTSTVIHTLDNLSDQNGSPALDCVDLFVANGSGAAIALAVTVAGGTVVTVDVADNAILQVFDHAVFQNAPNTTPAQIVATGAAAGLVFWGSFSR